MLHGERGEARGRRNAASTLWRNVAVVAATAVILLLTLMPVEMPAGVDREDGLSFRGVADAIANVLLFVPFGVAAALRMGGRQPVSAAVLLSVLIETAQLAIPGRYSSAFDIAFNTLGGAIGMVLVRRSELWLRPTGAVARLLHAGVIGALLAVVTGSAFLLRPSITERPLYGQWTADFATMARYEGKVLDASVGPIRTPNRRIRAPAEFRRHLQEGDTIRVRVRAGPPPPDLAPIFSIYDLDAKEMLLIGADGQDAVVRMRKRAEDFRLDQPRLEVRSAFAGIRAGDTIQLRFYGRAAGYCLEVNRSRWCDLGFTVGDGWALLYNSVPAALALVLPGLWLAGLALPIGFWCRTERALAACAVAVVVILASAPRAAGILPTTLPEYAAAIVGLVTGYAAGRAVESRASRGRPQTEPN